MRITEAVHLFLDQKVVPGSCWVDATLGNGHDALFLAERLGANGILIGFDLQSAAINASNKRLENEDCEIHLFERSHAQLQNALGELDIQQVDGVIYNLGYLPGSDKETRTLWGSTKVALDASARLLKTGGLLSITTYPGHPEGAEEDMHLQGWIQQAETLKTVEHLESPNQGPRWYCLEKR